MFLGPNAYKELVSSNQIDAVYVATPVYFHPEHFEAAVDAGKHVYLEKPVGLVHLSLARRGEAAEEIHRAESYGDLGRRAIREATVVTALTMLLDAIAGD